LKREFYPAFKEPRLINARVDSFKAEFGPWCAWMEEHIYSLPNFIKKVPLKQRPEYIEETIGQWPVKYVSDFSRFEASMRTEVMEAVEFVVYRHFGVPEWMLEVIGGLNRLRARGRLAAQVVGGRMSGEMNTSLGNGLTNLLITMFVLEKSGINGFVIVEGDDAICGAERRPDEADFLELGFKVVFEDTQNVATAGFCSMYWSSDRVLMCDPLRLMRLGWSLSCPRNAGARFVRQLRGAIATCLGYELGSCPIYWAWVNKFSETGRMRNEYWAREELASFGVPHEIRDEWIWIWKSVKVPEPSDATRLDYELLYGVPIQAQIEIESLITAGVDIDHPTLSVIFQSKYPDASLNWLEYVRYF
jgi:hypothetical protein